VSADGLRTIFVTRESLVAGDTDSRQDVYDRFGGTTTLVSTAPTGGNGAFDAFFEGVSSDGSTVFFTTNEKLTAADTDSEYDVYRHSGSATNLISAGSTGGNGAFPAFFEGASADGNHAFFTTSEKMTGTDTDARQDVYERFGSTTSQISVSGGVGGNGDFDAFYEGASKDGAHVFFRTYEKLASTDIDTYADVYERAGNATTERSLGSGVGGNGAYSVSFAGVSDDGSRVFFTTREKLVSADTDAGCPELDTTVPCTDVYQRSSNTTTLISTGPAGGTGTFEAFFAGMSPEGAHVFFTTPESLVSSDTDTTGDIYDRSGSTTSLVSTGPAGGNGSIAATFAGSAAGTHVFFTTSESLVSSDTDGRQDVYDRSGGTTTLVSVGPTGGNKPFFDTGFDGASDDGSRVFFQTDESLVSSDTDSSQDVYERFAGTTTLVSTGPASGFNLDMFYAGASLDGTRVLLQTSDRLLGTDTDNYEDVYASFVIPYDHPSASSQLNVSLVPSFRQTISATQCSSRGGTNSTHGPPLSNASCNPPAFPAGTRAHFGARSMGSVQLTALSGNLATTADEADVSVSVMLSDVHAGLPTGVPYDPVANGPDVTFAVKLRISDLLNGAALRDPGTVQDLELQVPVSCTAGSSPGNDCDATTAADAMTPGMIKEGKASVLASFRIRVNDAGSNGVRGDSDDRNFAMQGIYEH
jgi:hypothetical protein